MDSANCATAKMPAVRRETQGGKAIMAQKPKKQYFTPEVPINVIVHEYRYPKKETQVISDSLKAEITITADSTKEQVLECFRLLKADFKEHQRQGILEEASRAVVSVESFYGVNLWGTQPTLSEERRKLENSPPKKVKNRLQELKNIVKRYEQFPTLYAQKIRVNLPVNWRQEYATIDEAVKHRMENHKLETVAKAIQFYKELSEMTEIILNQKHAFVNEHAPELPKLIKQATCLRRAALRLQREIFDLLNVAPRGLRDKQVRTLVSAILKHKKFEREHNAVTAQLAQYNPDDPSCGLPSFPSSNYRLPSWIQVKVGDAEREVKK
jgi:hypothetical protein